jgi:hypothetical protein
MSGLDSTPWITTEATTVKATVDQSQSCPNSSASPAANAR